MIPLFTLLLLQDLSTLQGVAESAMRERRYADAAGIYRELAQKDPKWRLSLGMALSYANKHRDAVSELTAFTNANPQPGPAHLFLGVAYLKLEQPCEAIEPLQLALQWPLRPVSRWNELADAYEGCKRWEPAAKAYAEASKIDQMNKARLIRQSAHCWRMAHRYDLAKPLFASLAHESRYRTNAEFLFEYGDTLMRLDGAEVGYPWLEKAVLADPQLVPARSALGRALMALDRPLDAVPHLAHAAKEDPTLLLPLSRAYRALAGWWIQRKLKRSTNRR